MLPLYVPAAGWAWPRCRDLAWHDVFEGLAGLEDGGCHPPSDSSDPRAPPEAEV